MSTVNEYRRATAGELIKEIQDYVEQGESQSFPVSSTESLYQELITFKDDPQMVAVICAKIAINNSIMNNMVDKVSVQLRRESYESCIKNTSPTKE